MDAKWAVGRDLTPSHGTKRTKPSGNIGCSAHQQLRPASKTRPTGNSDKSRVSAADS